MKFFIFNILLCFNLAGFNTAKLFADYQYLMKIWTVRFIYQDFLIENFHLCFFSIHGYYDHILLIDGKNNRKKIKMKKKKKK